MACDAKTVLAAAQGAGYDRLSHRQILECQACQAGAHNFTPIPTCLAQPSGLIAWYRAENSVADQMGNANGTDNGGVFYGPGEVASTAFSFVGNGAYNSLGNPVALRLQTFTIDLWRKRKVAGEAGVSGFGQLISWDTGGWNFYENGTVNPATNGQILVGRYGQAVLMGTSANIANDTNWHHVACSIDGTGHKARLWIDGVPDVANPQTIAATAFSFAAGGLAIPGIHTDGFAGSIDELSIYNRVLSDAEILAIYTVGTGGKCLT